MGTVTPNQHKIREQWEREVKPLVGRRGDGVGLGVAIITTEFEEALDGLIEQNEDLLRQRVELQNSIGGYVTTVDKLCEERAAAWQKLARLEEQFEVVRNGLEQIDSEIETNSELGSPAYIQEALAYIAEPKNLGFDGIRKQRDRLRRGIEEVLAGEVTFTQERILTEALVDVEAYPASEPHEDPGVSREEILANDQLDEESRRILEEAGVPLPDWKPSVSNQESRDE